MTIIYVAGLISLLLTLILGKPYIEFLKHHFNGQYIYDRAPENHSKKQGTPTMGGIIIVDSILVAVILSFIMMKNLTTTGFIAICVLIIFAGIGFYDDFQKNKHHENKGLSPKGKLFLQIIGALLPSLYMVHTGATSIAGLDFGAWYLFIAGFIIVGASNAVNLTDGLDGLASGLCFLSFLTCAIILGAKGQIELSIIAASAACACLGFLYYNLHPAKVFMGDTGSLALGALLGTLGVLGKFELLLIPICLVFVIETLSVVIQVTSFKLTGKRVFKMSPIHHHFELIDWNETKIVKVFWIVGLLSCLIALGVFYGFFK